MVFYKLKIKREAEKEIRSLPKRDLRKVVQKIQGLSKNPRPIGCQKLRGDEGLRIRQGSYRIVYLVDDHEKVVRIIRVGHRKEVYR